MVLSASAQPWAPGGLKVTLPDQDTEQLQPLRKAAAPASGPSGSVSRSSVASSTADAPQGNSSAGSSSAALNIHAASVASPDGHSSGDDEALQHELEHLSVLPTVHEASEPLQQQLLRKVAPSDFEILRCVGQGAFGKVFQVMHKHSKQVYAMKVMRKERILQKDHGDYIKSERDLLTTVVHPYIVTLRFSFQTSSKLYLVLDFINGGHLFFNLYRQGVFSEEVARLYTAEIVLAVSYLHSIGIMHRDLKPENVLLDNEGHIKITDFGLAKGNMGEENARSNSFIGTMEYMAPEIIDGKGHTKDVDWWSTGILLYEMLCGVPPFRAKSRQALQQQILTSKVKLPKFLSSDAQNLLKGLLTRDPARRLGYGPSGSDAIKKHPFFKSINWGKLQQRQVESKFRPEVASCTDTTNFDKLWTEQPPEDSPCGTPSGTHAHEAFKGFTYIEPGFLETRGTLLFGSGGSSGAHHHHGSSGGGARRAPPALGTVAEGGAAPGEGAGAAMGGGAANGKAAAPPPVVLSTPPPPTRRITGFAAPSPAAATC